VLCPWGTLLNDTELLNVFRKWLKLQYRLNRRYLSLSFINRFYGTVFRHYQLFVFQCTTPISSHQPILSYIGYRWLPSYLVRIALRSVIWGRDGQLWKCIRIVVRRWKYILNLRRVWMKFCPMWNLTVCTYTRVKLTKVVGCVPQVGVCKLKSNKWKPIFVKKQFFHLRNVGDSLPENTGSYTRRSRSFIAVKSRNCLG
jgi:hypothetical protein